MKGEKSGPFSIDLGAKAEASLQLKGEIPTSAVGRLVNSVVDAFSPFTEQRGLRGDLLRLQREDVLLEIAKRARLRIDFEKDVIHPFPTKIIVPLLEKASLEDQDSELIDWWAGLISKGSTDKNMQHPIFSDFLSKMTKSEAVLLDKIVSWRRPADMETRTDIEGLFDRDVKSNLSLYMKEDNKKIFAEGGADEQRRQFREISKSLLQNFFDNLRLYGIVAIEASFPITGFRRTLKADAPYGGDYDIYRSIEHCVSIGILDKDRLSIPVPTPYIGEFAVNLHYAKLTATGDVFLQACRNSKRK